MSPAATAPTSNTTYIIGHKNPDADSICSALAYAAL
jgi:manganese-dependent inorganic pyrophosphatase